MIKAIALGAIVLMGAAACSPPVEDQIDDPWIIVTEGDPVPITNDVRIDILLLHKFGNNFQQRCDDMGGSLNFDTCENVDA